MLENLLFNSNEDIQNFVTFTNENRILFSRNVCGLLTEINIIYLAFSFPYGSTDQFENFFNQEAIKILNELLNESIPNLRSQLEVEFKTLLGVND